MAEFIHPTESEIEGPFLIDRPQLESLEKVLSQEWEHLQKEREKQLEDAVEREYKDERSKSWNKEIGNKELRSAVRRKLDGSYEFTEKRNCIITLKGGNAVTLPDLGTALRDPDLHDKEATGFYITLQSCRRECNVTLKSRWDCKLSIEVGPKRDQVVQQCLTVLKNWQNSVRPPVWMKWWRKLTGVGLHWSIWLLILFLSFQVLVDRSKSASKEEFRNQAIQLVTNGISADKHGKALELLLANAYDYRLSKPASTFPNWFFLLLFGGFTYCVALSLRPSVAIALGNGETKVRYWRTYSKFILITAPAFVFVTFYWPKIEALLSKLF